MTAIKCLVGERSLITQDIRYSWIAKNYWPNQQKLFSRIDSCYTSEWRQGCTFSHSRFRHQQGSTLPYCPLDHWLYLLERDIFMVTGTLGV